MFTARYLNKSINQAIHTPIQISLGDPKFKLPYQLRGIAGRILPTYDLLQLTDEEEYRERYIQRLERIGGAEMVFDALKKLAEPKKKIVLLCFEDIRKPGVWCHRRMFAEWWTDKRGDEVPELEEQEPPVYSAKERKDELKALNAQQYAGTLFE